MINLEKLTKILREAFITALADAYQAGAQDWHENSYNENWSERRKNYVESNIDFYLKPIEDKQEEQIKYMVNRFLGWKLPKNFQPDDGISFKKMFNEHTAYPMEHQPTGTNLFDATQAEEMIRYLIEGLE